MFTEYILRESEILTERERDRERDRERCKYTNTERILTQRETYRESEKHARTHET